MINKTHFTCKIAGDGTAAPKLDPDLPTVDHVIIDILIDVSKAGGGVGVALHLSRAGAKAALVIWCKEEAEQGKQPRVLQLCLSAASLTVPFELWEK